jgi:hypothetical protein
VVVSRARGQLGADLIASTPTGYRLTLTEDQVDASAVLLSAAASAQRARAGDHAAALASAEAGLALWAGPPARARLLQGPRPARSLVALRRLPPAPPDTLIRAIAVVLGTAPENRSALYELCDSDQPLVAGAANGIVSYYWGNEGDPERALRAARRALEAFEQCKFPYLQAVGHSRISELCLQVERGDEARRHLTTALPVLERLGAWSDLVGVRWWLVLANMQLGAVDEAEHWLEQTEPSRTSRSARSPTAWGSEPRSCSPAARSRPACACGDEPST